MENTSKSLSKFQKIVIYFIIYSFFGWLCEEIFCVIYTHEFVKRGFLFGPICPIYGYGAIIIILFLKNYKNKPIKLFFLAAIIFSAFEYITDYFLQALFSTKWWDYTGQFLNLNGRITLSFSLVWGIGSLIFIRLVHPLITKLVGKLLIKFPINFQKMFANSLIFIIILDTALSSMSHLHIF